MAASTDRVLAIALRRGWLEPEQLPAIRALRAAEPDRDLVDLLVEHAMLTPEQAGELQAETVREPRALPGETFDPSSLDRFLGLGTPGATRYELGELLGRGGMGEVVAATGGWRRSPTTSTSGTPTNTRSSASAR